MIEIPAATFGFDYAPRQLILSIPVDSMTDLGELLDEANTKRITQLYVRLSLPRKPRTTGFRSQSAHLHGHCQDIAKQARELGSTMTADDVKRWVKMAACLERAYPAFENPFTGEKTPQSEAQCDTREEALLIDQAHQIADEHGLYLTEYVNGQPVQVVGGVKE